MCAQQLGQNKFDVFRFVVAGTDGVFLLCFSLLSMMTTPQACVEELLFWINSLIMHAYNADTKTMPPIILVGTFAGERLFLLYSS